MKVREEQVRAWIDSMVGEHGPEEGETPVSPVAQAFLRGAFLDKDYIATYTPMGRASANKGLCKFLSFIEGCAATMREAGVKSIEESV